MCKKEKSLTQFYKTYNKQQKKSYCNSYCKKCACKYDRKRRYGLNTKQILILKKEQDNKCAICKTTLKKKFNIDHCHTYKYVRGILCYSCNTALGKFKDNPDIIVQAFNYVIKNENKYIAKVLYSYTNGDEHQKDN